MLTLPATLPTLSPLQDVAESLLVEHPTTTLIFIAILLFSSAELLRYFQRPSRNRREISLVKTGEQS
jgi:hypothetical protein